MTLGVGALTAVALVGFAANSLLCRAALAAGRIDAASFTLLRLAAGAAALVVIVGIADGNAGGRSALRSGSFGSAVALFAYAIAFSIAYLRIGAGVGALVLFGAVQTTMIGWGLARGERPSREEWLGLVIAIGGLLVLALPGLHAPDLRGVALMAGAGVAWGIYSLRGRGELAPLRSTAGNFARSVPLAIGASLAGLAFASVRFTPAGVLLAVVSGAVTSGVCYAVWYAALPSLSATRAAIVQLSVPAIAALGAVLLLGEAITTRLLVSGAAILGGVALAVLRRRRR